MENQNLQSRIESFVKINIVSDDPQSILDLIEKTLMKDFLWDSLLEEEKEWLRLKGEHIISIVTDYTFAGIIFVTFRNKSEGAWAYKIHQRINQPYPSVLRKINKLEKLGLLLVLKKKKGFDSKKKIFPHSKFPNIFILIYEIIKKYYNTQLESLFNQNTNRQLKLKTKKKK